LSDNVFQGAEDQAPEDLLVTGLQSHGRDFLAETKGYAFVIIAARIVVASGRQVDELCDFARDSGEGAVFNILDSCLDIHALKLRAHKGNLVGC